MLYAAKKLRERERERERERKREMGGSGKVIFYSGLELK
jgi:hypothetical protein